MHKKIIALLLVCVFAFSLTACGGSGSSGGGSGASGGGSSSGGGASAPSPILIGHSVALTGGSALWGESEKNALDMEIEKINADGGVLGRPIAFKRYDNKADATESVNVANRLIADGVVAIIGPAQSGVAIAATSVTGPAKMILIGTTTTNEKVTVEDGELHPYNFRTTIIDSYQGLVAANFAINDLKSKKAAILIDIGSDYSQGLAEHFIANYTKGGGEIVAEEAFRSEELDYRAQLGKIKDSGADLLFIPTMQKEAGLAMKQARDLGLTCDFLGGDAWASIELIELGGEATEGCFYVNLASLEDPVLADWVKAYKDKWGKDPVMPNPVFAVDALYVVIDAIKATNGTDSVAMAKHIENIKDLKVLTGNISFEPETHNPVGKSAVIETVKNGEFTFYKGIN